ncbi:hypothetical protein VFPPC_06800 [Pochonia chlamydosporia 170]|uniref:Rhodopsin domain-containing protein n=1 Tax=Pochonia chlamydosporia 170 TaxID=1380566 RepID=A0A179F5S9_METCM|nr:hypothetical protein VFPPC_06800 [Pochonia chlamydosporia 170]OAQ60691.1 hypothetical protein VFPPC_06800 [Pochonia chlamydosporia 170]
MAKPDNNGSWLISAMMISWVWSVLLYFVRVWAKLSVKRWGSEDYTVTTALLASTMDIGVAYRAIRRGYGLPVSQILDENRVKVEQLLYATQQLYVLAHGLSKISTGLFIIQLSYSGPQAKPGYVLVAATTLWTVASMLAVAFRGDLNNPWRTLDGSKTMHHRWIVIEITGLAIEILLLLLATNLVNGLHANARKRFTILAAFGARILLIPLVAIRLHLLSPSVNTLPTSTSIVPSIVTEVTLHFAVMSASITSLRPLLRTFETTYNLESKNTSQQDSRLNSQLKSGHAYHASYDSRLTIIKDHANQQQWTDELSLPNLAYSSLGHAPRLNRVSTAVTAVHNKDDLVTRASLASREGLPADAIIIQKTLDWEVQYERNNK